MIQINATLVYVILLSALPVQTIYATDHHTLFILDNK